MVREVQCEGDGSRQGSKDQILERVDAVDAVDDVVLLLVFVVADDEVLDVVLEESDNDDDVAVDLRTHWCAQFHQFEQHSQ